MDAEAKLTRLKMILHEYTDLANVAMLLNWDMQTYMPVGGSKGRGNQNATINRLAHEKLTAPEVGQTARGPGIVRRRSRSRFGRRPADQGHRPAVRKTHQSPRGPGG